MRWKKFNDQLAILFILLIVGLWVADPIIEQWYGVGISRDAIGATIVIFTLVAQYYFRRKDPNDNGGELSK